MKLDRRFAYKISIIEGIMANLFTVMTQGQFITGLLILLGATTFHFALFTAIPTFVTLMPLIVSIYMNKKQPGFSKKKETIKRALAGRLILVSIILIPFVVPNEYGIYAAIMLFAISTLFGSVCGIIWQSWMTDITPPAIRGRFFGNRGFYLTLAIIPVTFLAGYFLDLAKSNKIAFISSLSEPMKKYVIGIIPNGNINEYFGILVIFVCATILGIISTIILSYQPEIKVKNVKQNAHAYKFSNLRKILKKNVPFRKLLIFRTYWMFINGFAAPIWLPFTMKNLKIDYYTIAILIMLSQIAAMIAIKFWGKIIDRFGNKPIISFTNTITALHPLLYVIATPIFIFPMYIDWISSGIMWGGFDLACTKTLYGAAEEKTKELHYALYTAIPGIFLSISALLSGLILDKIPTLSIGFFTLDKFTFLFLFIFIGRMCGLFFIKDIKEVKQPATVFVMLYTLKSEIIKWAYTTPKLVYNKIFSDTLNKADK